MDQRFVGSAMRRRMGAPSSHLGMAGNPGQEAYDMGGRSRDGRTHGIGDYSTGDGAVGEDPRILATDPAEFVSEVSAIAQNEPHPAPHRIEAGSARLTVSPSMKLAEESPAPTQWNGRIVQSRPGRSRVTFDSGASEEMQG